MATKKHRTIVVDGRDWSWAVLERGVWDARTLNLRLWVDGSVAANIAIGGPRTITPGLVAELIRQLDQRRGEFALSEADQIKAVD